VNGLLNDPQTRHSELISTGLVAATFVFALAMLAGGMAAPVAQAASEEHDQRRNGRDHDGQDGRHDNSGRRDQERHERDERRRYEQQHYWRYQQPVYAPPPVYYPPPASPGINLVLPLEIRIR